MDIQQEIKICILSAQVEQQEQQIAELQKQLADMQLTSCELEAINNATLMAISNNLIEIKKLMALLFVGHRHFSQLTCKGYLGFARIILSQYADHITNHTLITLHKNCVSACL